MMVLQQILYIIKRLPRLWLDRPIKENTHIAGKYRVSRLLGTGSFGLSYLCYDEEEKRTCVVKQLRPSRQKKNSGTAMYEREISMLKKLNHPAIPSLIDRFDYNGQLFFVMEYINGTTLDDVIFRYGDRFSEKEALQLIRKLLEIVQYLHAEGVIHRDLRLPNVMRAKDQLYIIDFGLARDVDDETARNNDAAERYLEEKKLRREIHVRSDFYALGHFLLHVLYSSFKPESKAERPWSEELTLHPSTKHLIHRMLQTEKPYEDIDELRLELEQIIANL